MGAVMVISLIVLVLLVIGFFAMMTGALTKGTAAGHVEPADAASSAHNLHYQVPRGQDPAVVRAALNEAGYDSAAEVQPEGDVLTIVLHEGTDAEVERVREILANTQETSMLDPDDTEPSPVRFVEETG